MVVSGRQRLTPGIHVAPVDAPVEAHPGDCALPYFKVIEESGIEFEHEVEDTDEVVEKFKEFLDQVSPDDFMTEG